MTEFTVVQRWGRAVGSPGKTVARLRNAMEITQPQLADYLGVTTVTVARWETEATMPSPDKMEKLRDLFVEAMSNRLIGLKRTALEKAGLSTDTPAFQEFIKHVQHRVWFITHAVTYGGLAVMRASFWCLLFNLEPHVLADVPVEEPTLGRSPFSREPWQVETPGEMPPEDEHRPLQGFLVAAALEAATRGIPFARVVDEYEGNWEEAGIGWVQRLEFELAERLRWLQLYAGLPSLRGLEKTEEQQRAVLTQELRNRRQAARRKDKK